MSDAPAGGIVVRLRGLPTKATKEDVAEFLKEWQPRAVYLSFTARRSTGEAYVVFDKHEQALGACSKDKDIFGPKFGERYVRVCVSEDTAPEDLQTLDGATKASKPRRPNQKMDTVVKVAGLPRGITPPEVLQLFWGWRVQVAHTYIRDAPSGAAAAAAATAGTSSDGAGTSGSEGHAEAFIDFELAEHAAAAVSSRHGTTITTAVGAFRLSLSKVSRAEWDAVLAAQGSGCDGIVRVRLPAKAAPGDVLAFFQGYAVKPGGVHVQPAIDSRHNKLALVEFESAAEAVRAMERDRQRLGEAFGDRCCQLELVRRAEFEQELQRFWLQGGGPGAPPGNGASSSSGGTTTQGTAAGGGLRPASLAALPISSMSMGAMAGPLGGPMGMLPHAAAAAAGFMTPGLPPIAAAGMGMLPPVAPFGMPPGMPPGWPAPPGMPAAAHMQQFVAPGSGLPAGMPGMAPPGGLFSAQPWPPMPPNPSTARYMVQDLTTGQKVFLDPRFNLSGYGVLPPGLASCSAVATAGTTYGGATATGPAASQQTQSAPAPSASGAGAEAAAEAGAAAAAAAAAAPPAGEMSEDSNRQGTAGTLTMGGQSRDATPANGNGGNGGGSSGNGYSVAVAGSAAAGGNGANKAGTSIEQQGHDAAAADGSGSGGNRQGSIEQPVAGRAGEQPHAPKHRHSHHHHHHHSHHHHHHHYRMARSNANGGGDGGGGSSGDEGRTNVGSGGGSNDGSEGGNGSGADADGGDGNGRSSNKPAAAAAAAAADDSSGNDGGGGGAGAGGRGSSGEDDGATARTAAHAAAAGAGDCGFSHQGGGDGGHGERTERGSAADMDEDAAAPPKPESLPSPGPGATATAPRPAPMPEAAQAGQAGSGSRVHSHGPDDPAALKADGVEPPPAKRARSQ